MREVGLPAGRQGLPRALCRDAGATGGNRVPGREFSGDGPQGVLDGRPCPDEMRQTAIIGHATHDDERLGLLLTRGAEFTQPHVHVRREPPVEFDLALTHGAT